MLKLILGRQKTGKTHHCLAAAETAASDGKNVIMLVPEQYSFECQKHLLESLGPQISNRIDIHSFTSLCEAVCAVNGGLAGKNVDDGTRYILVGQAVKSVRDSLKMYARYADSASFIGEMMSVITELKQASVSADALLRLSKNTDSEIFSGKLHDTALILSAYDALVGNRFADPLCLIERTVAGMRDNSFFKGKTVIIDEFKGFTEAQYSMLDRIIAGCDNVIVSLCCDSLVPSHDTDIFTNVKRAAARLISIAESHAIAVEKPTVLTDCGRFSADISALESLLAESKVTKFEDSTPNITVCKADNAYDEIDYCMNTIRRLVREEGMRYRDFVIISRGQGVYSNIIDDVSKTYKIPCYLDNRVSVLNLPFSVFMLSVVKAAVNFDTEEILRLAKTGLVGLNTDDIARLENYVYVWNINNKRWLSEWTMNVAGLSKNNVSSEEAERQRKETAYVESLRKRLIKPLENLCAKLNGAAEEICTALFCMMEDYGAVGHLREYTEKLEKDGKLQQAEYQRAGYDVFIKVLDKITSVLGDSKLNASEFSEILKSSLSFESVGEIPQTQDQVIYGTADRIRPMRPKVVFVIGVNQDVFPAAVSNSGLFTQNEREKMINEGLKVSDRNVSECLDEKFLFYFACTCASDKVFISYSRATANGSAMEPSIELSSIIKAFPQITVAERGGELNLDEAETEEASFRKLAEHFSENSNTVNAFKAYFSKKEDYNHRIEAIEKYISGVQPAISQTSAAAIYGDEVKLSASKADDFAGCKFMYFCKYGIGARKNEKVDFDPLTRGNIVHYLLEMFVSAHINDIGNLKDDDIKAETDKYCDRYLVENCSDISALDDKFNFMMNIIKDTVSELAKALNREFALSAFRPRYCELKVGDGEQVKGIDVFTDNGHRVTLNGYIDRVDTTADGKVRVIDYKTGSKGDDFKLSELLNGQNMQMLLYLYALLKNGKELLQADKPAGVLYFPAKRSATKEKTGFVKMHGIVLEDLETVKQMEPDSMGKVIPVRTRPGSQSYYSTESLVTEEAFSIIFRYIELLLQRIGSSLMSGDISPKPLRSGDSLKCKYCDYSAVCRFDPYLDYRDSLECKNKEAVEQMQKELEEAEHGN